MPVIRHAFFDPMSTRRRIVLALVVLLVTIFATVVILVPILVDLDRYRPEVIARIRKATGKRAEIGRLALTLVSTVSIRIDDFALASPPGFPQGYSLTARRIYAEVDATALWHRQIIIKSLELDGPVFNLLLDVRGDRNLDSPHQQQSPKKASDQGPSFLALEVITRLKIKDGELTAATLLPSGHPGPIFFEARGISSQLDHVDLNTFNSPKPALLVSPTTSSPKLRQPAGNAAIAFADGPRGVAAGQGTFKAEFLRCGRVQATAVKSKLRLGQKQVFLDDLNFDFYRGHATGDFDFNFAGPNPRYNLEARVRDVDVAKLLAEFAKGRGKMRGTMEGNLTLGGEVTHASDPLAGKRGAGQVMVRKGQLPNLQLNKNLLQLACLGDLGPASGDPSSFSSISADLDIANQRITSQRIKILGNGVDVDASGSLTLAGESTLSYEGVAKVRAGQNPLTNIVASLSGAKFADGKLSFPFDLVGTLENPRFILKSAAGRSSPGGIASVPGVGAEQRPAAQPDKTEKQQPDLIKKMMDLFKKKQQP